jgi:hypothetical protein
VNSDCLFGDTKGKSQKNNNKVDLALTITRHNPRSDRLSAFVFLRKILTTELEI